LQSDFLTVFLELIDKKDWEKWSMTIDKMAKELGVSKSTISRALSGKGRIGEETRIKICTYAKEQGFTPRASKGKSKTLTRNLGVVLPADAYTTSIPFFQESLLGICEVAVQMDYNVLVTTRTESDISGIQALVEKRKVDGIILTRGMEEDLAVKYLSQILFPVGMIGSHPDGNVIQVDCDNRAASESLTAMLIGRGYRRFAVILGSMSISVNRRRYEGVLNAWERNGIIQEQQLVYSGCDQMEFWDNLIAEIMARKVECIICGDDVICTKITSRIQAEGYRIPMDISIASLYNSPNLNCFSPAITTVNVSAKTIGNLMGKQMIHYLCGEDCQKKIYLDYEILFRKSTIRAWKE